MGTRASLRTDQKLRYAHLTITELDEHRSAGSNDEWTNAHQEAVFYHLVGAIEGLLHEINDAYGLDLAASQVRWDQVSSKIVRSGLTSTAFEELESLRNDANSWLAQLYVWRNHGAHRARVSKVVYLSAGKAPEAEDQFRDPRTGQVQTIYPELGCHGVLRVLTKKTEELIGRCRGEDSML